MSSDVEKNGNVQKKGNPELPIAPALAAVIPAFIGAVVLYIFRKWEAEELGNVAAAGITIMAGTPIFKRSRELDLRHGEATRTTVAVALSTS